VVYQHKEELLFNAQGEKRVAWLLLVLFDILGNKPVRCNGFRTQPWKPTCLFLVFVLNHFKQGSLPPVSCILPSSNSFNLR
jgi:hypothetical protein